jgi:hypothetical protein
MDPLHVAHFFAVTLWLGLALGETVLEAGATDDESRRFAAKLHYRLDMFLELPLLLVVLGTGGSLAARAWPFTTLHWIKVGAGLVAVGANLLCVGAVVARRRQIEDPRALERWTSKVRLTGLAGPFFLTALALGLVYFRA